MSNAIIIQNTDHQKIISILSTEISKDGGACLVRDLKEYNPSIDALLKGAAILTTIHRQGEE